MKKELQVGKVVGGKQFSLPLDFVTRTLAIVAIRGAGKTVAATVLAEEMAEAGLPWIAFDPIGVWWGLRVNPDGSPGGRQCESARAMTFELRPCPMHAVPRCAVRSWGTESWRACPKCHQRGTLLAAPPEHEYRNTENGSVVR